LNSITKCPIEEQPMQYVTKTIPRTLTDVNLLPTTAQELRNITNSL
jgi:hypothetical protein